MFRLFASFSIPQIVLLIMVAAGWSTQSLAVPITTPVVSTFDSSCDGWTGNATSTCDEDGVPSVGVSWTTDEDLQFNEGNSVEAPDTWVVAPAEFLGDWSVLDGMGSIQYDHRILNSGNNNGRGARQIYLSGGGSSATWSGPLVPNGDYLSTSWETFTAPLVESAWAVTGSWSDLLSNVESLQIRVDLYSSYVGSAEAHRIDNVQLVPEPSTAALLVAGLVGLARAGRSTSRAVRQ